ncbi:PAS domain S-box protein [Microvirga sp. HBU67558]|uniref:PAS domain-containing sensor histidine kinase n=1 Tax=Microvirga TaxID=186650 RepID=UPI001B376E74|nr:MULTISPECIES: PAS domain-containing sensor histidine kinase [unclassified Microvirga]MBQ0822855.1 PAS domain S-box protein [Microvirga sp. HBU67558]
MSGGQQSSDFLTGERRFQLLVNALSDYAIYLLDPQGHVVSWNSGAQRCKGYTELEILGQPYAKFYTEEDRAAGEPARALEAAARDGRHEAEGWRVRKDGSRFWASTVIDPIRDKHGALLGFAKITRDITEPRKAQEAVEQARAALFQAHKMEAVAQLTGGIAHDFNNILTVIMGNLDMLRRAPEERRIRLIDQALQAVDQARRTTQQLLSFSRRQALSPKVLDLNRLILGMDAMLAQSLRGDIRLELDLADQVWPVDVDPSQLEIALINLASNARDAMPNGGTLRIRTGNKASRDGGVIEGVAVSVSDTGAGIPREALVHVFEPFFTTKTLGQGTGLGLAQVYGFAEQSGGSVEISSEVGRGTTVAIFLPRAQEEAPKVTAEPDIAEEMRNLRILLVEDNAAVASVALLLLNEQGHEAVHVGTAQEALDVLASGQPFDLVFSDLVMPGGMDGLELAESIQSRWPALPILLATGYSDAASKAARDGFPLISKPYQPDALRQAVHRAAVSRERPPGDSNVVPLERPTS